MKNDDVRRGATSAFTMVHAYVLRAAEELGVEKALAMDAEVGRRLGAARGRSLKERMPGKEFDIAQVREMLAASIKEDFGIHSEMVGERPGEIVVRCGRCPVYDAAAALGMDGATIEAGCRASAIGYMDALAAELNPRARYELRRFRNAAEDPCEEAIVLAEVGAVAGH
jgi:hypothetical protein